MLLEVVDKKDQREQETFVLDIFADLVSDSGVEAFRICHLFLHLCPWEL